MGLESSMALSGCREFILLELLHSLLRIFLVIIESFVTKIILLFIDFFKIVFSFVSFFVLLFKPSFSNHCFIFEHVVVSLLIDIFLLLH